MEDRCVICGEIIPEGRQVCPLCEKKYGEKDFAEGVRLGVRLMLTTLPIDTSKGETTVKKNDQIRALVNAFTDF
ncbi:MAG: hypothetical protein IK099_06780 [Clostridia bacterium]|nr:hypothetical protein [Clostridia bacterium]